MEDLVAESLDDPGQDLAAVNGACVVHRGKNSLNLKSRVKPVTNFFDDVHEQCDAAEGEELALQRDDHTVRGRQGIHREQAERRLAVDQDQVVVGQHGRQDAGQGVLARHLVDELTSAAERWMLLGSSFMPGWRGKFDGVQAGESVACQPQRGIGQHRKSAPSQRCCSGLWAVRPCRHRP